MLCPCPSRVPTLPGKQCPAIGAKTGKATLTSMVKHSPSRSQQVMGSLWFLTMLPLQIGRLDKPTLAHSFTSQIQLLIQRSSLQTNTHVSLGEAGELHFEITIFHVSMCTYLHTASAWILYIREAYLRSVPLLSNLLGRQQPMQLVTG